MNKVKHIYGLINAKNKIFYIGATVNLSARLRKHKFESYKILETVEYSLWQEHEKYWIKYGRENGWPLINKSDGGQGCNGVKYSNETKRKLSELKLGNTYAKGYKHTNEAKLKISKSHLGKKLSIEHRQKLSNILKGHKGHKHTDEAKQRISEAKKLYWENKRKEKQCLLDWILVI